MNGRHVHTTSVCVFTMLRSSSGLIACWILARTSSLVTWSFLRQHLISMACILCCSAVRVHDSTSVQEDGRKKGVQLWYTGTERNSTVVANRFQLCQYCSRFCYPEEHLGWDRNPSNHRSKSWLLFVCYRSLCPKRIGANEVE